MVAGLPVDVLLTGDTGTFWFFDSANVELVLKVLDGRVLNGHYWVFYGALSNVEYTIVVTAINTEGETASNPLTVTLSNAQVVSGTINATAGTAACSAAR